MKGYIRSYCSVRDWVIDDPIPVGLRGLGFIALLLILMCAPLSSYAQRDPNVVKVSSLSSARAIGAHNGDLISNGNLRLNLGFGYLNTQPGSATFSVTDQGFGPGISVLPRLKGWGVRESSGDESSYTMVSSTGHSTRLLQGDLSTLQQNGAKGFKRTLEDGTIEFYSTRLGNDWLLTSVTDAAGYQSTITYAPASSVPTRITGPDKLDVVRYETSQSLFPGQRSRLITKATYADGSAYTFEYSQDGYLKKVTGMDGTALIEIVRDTLGWKLPTEVKSLAGTTEYAYYAIDGLRAVVSGIIQPDGKTTQYTRSSMSTTISSGGETTYRYNRNNLVEVKQNGEVSYTAEYSGDRLIKETGADGTVTTYSYAVNAPFPNKITSNGVTTEYTYSPTWKTTSVTETFPGGSRKQVFTYDASQRLTQVATLSGAGTEVSRTTYAYIGSSKLPLNSVTTQTTTAQLNARGVPTSVTGPDGLRVANSVTTDSSKNETVISTDVMGLASRIAQSRSGANRVVTTLAGRSLKTTEWSIDGANTKVTRKAPPRTTSGSQDPNSWRTTLAVNRAVTFTDGGGSTASNSCTSEVDGCTTTRTCTPDPANPDGCSWTETTTCKDKQWPPPSQCVPSCAQCGGPDGCGGTCQTGACPVGESCNAGICVRPQCKPNCPANKCAISDGCGASCNCSNGLECDQSTFTCKPKCTPQCSGKQCGSDGCGGTCGACKTGFTCSSGNRCLQNGGGCVPNCAGKTCGDNGCGGSCGTCAGGASNCVSGQCVDPGSCTPGGPRFGGANQCNAPFIPEIIDDKCYCVLPQGGPKPGGK